MSSNDTTGVANLQAEEHEYEPRKTPFAIDASVSGTVNGTEIDVDGIGTITQPGVYRAELEFSEIPDGFHPSIFAAQMLSISCSRISFTRNTPNMEERGVEKYESTRTITGEGIDLTVSGEAHYRDDSLDMDLTVSGECDLPADVVGTTSYFVKWEPTDDGIIGTGEVSLAREGNKRIPTKMDSKYHSIEPDPLPVPFEGPQYRIVTEAGDLEGRTYESEVHSLLDTGTVFEEIDQFDPDYQ